MESCIYSTAHCDLPSHADRVRATLSVGPLEPQEGEQGRDMALTCLAAPLKVTLSPRPTPSPSPSGDWLNAGSILLFRPQLKNTRNLEKHLECQCQCGGFHGILVISPPFPSTHITSLRRTVIRHCKSIFRNPECFLSGPGHAETSHRSRLSGSIWRVGGMFLLGPQSRATHCRQPPF